MKMTLLLLAVLLTSASEVQRLFKGANLTEKELSKEEIRDFASQMKSRILKDEGIASKKSPEFETSIENHKETIKDKLCELFKISKDVFAIMIHFAGTEGMEKLSKTSKKFEKLAPYIYQTLEQIPLAVRNVQNSAVLQANPDHHAMFHAALKPKRLSASIPFRLMNGEFLADPNADPALICGLQNKKTGSFCAFRASNLDALNLETSAKSCPFWFPLFSDVLKFPRYNKREVPRIRKMIQCLVSHPNQNEPNQFYLSCASKPELLGYIGGQALLVCTSEHKSSETGMLYEYISESNKGVFSWSRSPSKHIFMNENVIAFCGQFHGLQGQYVRVFSVFGGGTKSFTDSRVFDEPKATMKTPIIKSHQPGHVCIEWSENDVSVVTPESDWRFDDEDLIQYFKLNLF